MATPRKKAEPKVETDVKADVKTDVELVPRESNQMTVVPQQESAMIMSTIERLSDTMTPEVMSRWMDMYDRVEKKGAEKQFFAALSQLQAEVPSIDRDGKIKNREGNVVSKYSTYDAIMVAVKPLLKQYGFSFTCLGDVRDNVIHITAILGHTGGHSITNTLPLPSDMSGFKNQVQGAGSALAYGRRYQAIMMLNIVSADGDDDGVGATFEKKPDYKTITGAQVALLRAKLKVLGEKAESDLLVKLKIDDLKHLQAERFDGAMKFVKSTIEKQNQKSSEV